MFLSVSDFFKVYFSCLSKYAASHCGKKTNNESERRNKDKRSAPSLVKNEKGVHMDIKNYTRKQLYDAVFKLLDQYSKNGTVITDTAEYCADIAARIPSALSAGLKKAYADVPVKKTVKLCFPENHVDFHLTNVKFPPGHEFGFTIENDSNTHYLYASIVGSLKLTAKYRERESEIFYANTKYGIFDTVKKRIHPNDSTTEYVFSTGANSVHIDNLAVYTPAKSLNLYDENYVPPFGKSCCAVPEDFGSVLSMTNTVSGHKVCTDVFSYEDNMLVADEAFAGVYSMKYLVRSPEIAPEVQKTYTEATIFGVAPEEETFAISQSRFELASRWAAAELCPPEDGEVYSMLIRSYNELVSALCKKSSPDMRTRNTFFGASLYRKSRTGGDC